MNKSQNRFFQTMTQKLNEAFHEKLNQALGHPLRPILEEKVTSGLREFKELKEFALHPSTSVRSFGLLLDERSPWLGRHFLGAASKWAEPFTVGMGFKVQKIGEDAVEVRLPGKWRNQGAGGVVHSAALAALGEFAVRLYWEHHLDVRHSGVESKRMQVRILSRPVGEMKAVFRLPVVDREAILHRLRTQQHVDTETQVHVYDSAGRLIAEVDADWFLCRRLTLSSHETRA
jgi:acyl-coenzyme A thioesterase PaaI-like protein